MPLGGYIRQFSSSKLFRTLVVLFFFVFTSLLIPTDSSAAIIYKDEGGTCKAFWQEGPPNFDYHEDPVSDALCDGVSPPAACQELETERDGYCSSAKVPGVATADCNDDDLKVEYVRDLNTGKINGIQWWVDCEPNITWSEYSGPQEDDDLEIDYWSGSGEWRTIRDGNFGNKGDYKIRNDETSRTVLFSNEGLRNVLKNTTSVKHFIVFPSCAGEAEKAIDADCYRADYLEPVIEDFGAPNCNVTFEDRRFPGFNPRGFQVNVNMSDYFADGGTGLGRMGLFLEPTGGGALIPIHNNDIRAPFEANPPPEQYLYQEFIPEGTLPNPAGNYQFVAKVWDWLGNRNYDAAGGGDAGEAASAANMRICKSSVVSCIMPSVVSNDVATCVKQPYLPSPEHPILVSTLQNLSETSRCPIEYVDISPLYSHTDPNYNASSAPFDASSITIPVAGLSSKDLIDTELKWPSGAKFDLNANYTYNVRYRGPYGSPVPAVAYGSFRTPRYCNPPDPPRITATPICRLPYNPSVPTPSTQLLTWNPPISAGDGGYQHYITQVATAKDPTTVVYTVASMGTSSSWNVGSSIYAPYIPTGGTYYYRMKSGGGWAGDSVWSNWVGTSTASSGGNPQLLRRLPYSPALTVVPNPSVPSVQMNWTYDSPEAPVTGWNVARTGATSRSFSLAGTERSYTDTSNIACVNSNYNYSMTGSNVCGTGAASNYPITCHQNQPPTCGNMWYSINNGATWLFYPGADNDPNFVIRNAGTSILVRRACTDPEGSSVVYRWLSSCGTFSPSYIWNNNTSTYTFPGVGGAGCDITSRVADAEGLFAPDDNGIAQTFPPAAAGTHTLAQSLTIRRTAGTKDDVYGDYQVISGVEQSNGRLIYRIRDYVNPTLANPNVNLPGEIEINTSVSNVMPDTKNICRSGNAVCTLSTSTGGTGKKATVTAEDSDHNVNIILDENFAEQNRDVFNDNGSPKFGVRIDFIAERANPDETVSTTTVGVPAIENKAPVCHALTFNPVSPATSATGNSIDVTLEAGDDWALKGLTSFYYAPLSNLSNINPVHGYRPEIGPFYFSSQNRYATTAGYHSWKLDGLASETYRFFVTVTDDDGQSKTCMANVGVGTSNQGGSASAYPQYLLARTPPECGQIEYTENPTAPSPTWVVYPPAPGSINKIPGSTLTLRRVCTHAGPVTYEWTTSCGSVSPSNASRVVYTYPSTNSASCDITSRARDAYFNYAPNDNAIATTPPPPNAGTHTMLAGRTIQRLSTSDAYATINGVLQDTATLTYRINGYNNPSAANTSVNLPGTLTINTTSTGFRVGGITKENICHATYGKCVFAATGTASITLDNMTSAPKDSVINITFDTPAKVAAVRDIFDEPTSTGGYAVPTIKYAVRANFASTTATGTNIAGSATALPGIINNPPFCESVDFVPASPYRGGNVSVITRVRDDWGVNGLRVAYGLNSQQESGTLINNAKYFPTLPRSGEGTAVWNTSPASIASNYYWFGITMTDADGGSQFCNARIHDIEGDETVPGDNLLPTVLVDKVRPICDSFTTQLNSTNLTQLRFITTARDPITNGTYSGLSSLTFSHSANGINGFTPISTIAIPGSPQTYAFDRAAPPVWDFNLNTIPSGTRTFRAQWTDRAGNLNFCSTTYEKGNRISAEVTMRTGPNGTDKEAYVYEAGTGAAVPFRIVTRPTVTGALTDAVISPIAGSQLSACRAAYPGDSSHPTVCTGFFISGGAEFAANATPTVELRFPTIPGTSTRGKYNCRMNLFDNTNPDAPELVRTLASSGNGGICRFTLLANEITVDPVNPYGVSTKWPTHIEFEVAYNSNQVYGEIRDENGDLITTGGTAVVENSSGVVVGTSGAISSGTYSAPASTTNNSLDYAYSPASYAVDLSLADPTKLCVWVTKTTNDNTERNEFRNMFNNATTVAARRALVGNIARTFSAGAGWTGGASPLCRVPSKSFVRGNMSPKYQNQINFVHIPKVKITGEIYYVNDESLCPTPSEWEANQVTSGSVDIDLSFVSTPDLPGTDDFDSPDEGATPGTARYQTGDTYTFYANMLPGANWNTWSIARDVDFPNALAGRFIDCPINRSITVRDRIGNYPEATEINVPIAIVVPETNDWWQAYNGGIHAQTGLANAIPDVISNGEIDGQADILNRLVGNPTRPIYGTTGPARVRLKAPFTGYFAGGLITSTRALGNFPIADAGRVWRIAPASIGQTIDMTPFRAPYITADENTELSAIEKLKDLGGWTTTIASLPTSSKVFIDGSASINTAVQLNGAFKYLVVDGNLNINRNILNSGTNGTLFIIATGDVVISGGSVANPVNELNAVIYTPRTITINTLDKDGTTEQVLKVYGGLYAGDTIETQRDIANTPENFGLPSLQVIYNPALIVNSKNPLFPVELKEANVYWIRE